MVITLLVYGISVSSGIELLISKLAPDSKKIKDIDDYTDAIKGLKGDVLVYTDRGFTIVKE